MNQPPVYYQQGGPPPAYQAYGAPPGAPNPYGAPNAQWQNAAPGPMGSGAFASAAAASKTAVVMAGIMACVPLLRRAVVMTVGGSRALGQGLDGLESILQLVALICFFVWIARATAAVRATQGTSAYSPGWAVGWWFIPLANFIVPFFTVRDVWKRTMGDDGRGVVVGVWWAGWIATTCLKVFDSLLVAGVIHGDRSWNGMLSTLGWFTSAAKIATWVCLLLTMRWITERTTTQRTA